ncbi:MAG: Zn-binding domain-containing protein [Armatimonadota bacterium]
MHHGNTYLVTGLDLVQNRATVRRVDVDYYTQPLGGTDVDHVDRCLKQKPFGAGEAFWGEVTAHFRTDGYEKIRFYELDAVSRHGLDLPTMYSQTMAFWLVPPEWLMQKVAQAGLDVYQGLRGVGYAIRMMLPLFVTCETLDFSHSVGAANAPWNAVFVYERYPLGLGFTERAYERLEAIIPAVLSRIRECECADGCPSCVGKPLRQEAVWNVERGEGSIPSKRASIMILKGLLGNSAEFGNERHFSTDAGTSKNLDLAVELRRRLDRPEEPLIFGAEGLLLVRKEADADESGVLKRTASAARDFHRELRRRLSLRRHVDNGRADTPEQVESGGRLGGSMSASPRHDALPPRELGDPIAAEALRRLRAARRKSAETNGDAQ